MASVSAWRQRRVAQLSHEDVPKVGNDCRHKANRLQKSAQFDAALTSAVARWHVRGALIVAALRSDGDVPRLGVSIPRRLLKRAVDRNRFKRLVKEVFRSHESKLPGLDIVVLGKRGVADCLGTKPASSSADFRSELSDGFKGVAQKAIASKQRQEQRAAQQ